LVVELTPSSYSDVSPLLFLQVPSIWTDVTPSARYNWKQWWDILRLVLELVTVLAFFEQISRNVRCVLARRKEVSMSDIPL